MVPVSHFLYVHFRDTFFLISWMEVRVANTTYTHTPESNKKSVNKLDQVAIECAHADLGTFFEVCSSAHYFASAHMLPSVFAQRILAATNFPFTFFRLDFRRCSFVVFFRHHKHITIT